MSEQTRAEYDAKYEDLSRRIQELEDERDALQMLPEDQEYYASNCDPAVREITRVAVAGLASCNALMKQFVEGVKDDRVFFGGSEWPAMKRVKPPKDI